MDEGIVGTETNNSPISDLAEGPGAGEKLRGIDRTESDISPECDVSSQRRYAQW